MARVRGGMPRKSRRKLVHTHSERPLLRRVGPTGFKRFFPHAGQQGSIGAIHRVVHKAIPLVHSGTPKFPQVVPRVIHSHSWGSIDGRGRETVASPSDAGLSENSSAATATWRRGGECAPGGPAACFRRSNRCNRPASTPRAQRVSSCVPRGSRKYPSFTRPAAQPAVEAQRDGPALRAPGGCSCRLWISPRAAATTVATAAVGRPRDRPNSLNRTGREIHHLFRRGLWTTASHGAYLRYDNSLDRGDQSVRHSPVRAMMRAR